jgi:hypothetical protein
VELNVLCQIIRKGLVTQPAFIRGFVSRFVAQDIPFFGLILLARQRPMGLDPFHSVDKLNFRRIRPWVHGDARVPLVRRQRLSQRLVGSLDHRGAVWSDGGASA